MSESVVIAEAIIQFGSEGFAGTMHEVVSLGRAMDDLGRISAAYESRTNRITESQRSLTTQTGELTQVTDEAEKSVSRFAQALGTVGNGMQSLFAGGKVAVVKAWQTDWLGLAVKIGETVAAVRLFGKVWHDVGLAGRFGRSAAGMVDDSLFGGRGRGVVSAIRGSRAGPYIDRFANFGARLPTESGLFGSLGGKIGANIGGMFGPAAGMAGGGIGTMLGSVAPIVGAVVGILALLKLQFEIIKKIGELAVAVWIKALTEGAKRVPEWASEWKKLGKTIDTIFGNFGEPLIRALLPFVQDLNGFASALERLTRGAPFRLLAGHIEGLGKSVNALVNPTGMWAKQLVESDTALGRFMRQWNAAFFGPAKGNQSSGGGGSQFVSLENFTKTLQSRLKEDQASKKAEKQRDAQQQQLKEINQNTAPMKVLPQLLKGGVLAVFG